MKNKIKSILAPHTLDGSKNQIPAELLMNKHCADRKLREKKGKGKGKWQVELRLVS